MRIWAQKYLLFRIPTQSHRHSLPSCERRWPGRARWLLPSSGLSIKPWRWPNGRVDSAMAKGETPLLPNSLHVTGPVGKWHSCWCCYSATDLLPGAVHTTNLYWARTMCQAPEIRNQHGPCPQGASSPEGNKKAVLHYWGPCEWAHTLGQCGSPPLWVGFIAEAERGRGRGWWQLPKLTKG